jgi:DNA-binding CsgD family transcriptional regulator
VILVGRREECDELDRLLATVRDGRGAVLVIRGDAGVGKTALADYAADQATEFRVTRAVGVQSEMELAFAALQQLCWPMLDRLELLPDPQRDALSAAFGLSTGTAPQRYLIGLAVLSLLSETSREQPLLCIIDDAHWLDLPSAQALAFVARRLLAEPVGLIFVTRVQTEALGGLPEVVVEGLADRDARTLLASTIRVPLDDRVRDRIVAETHGNPLALLELPRGLTPAELAVGFGGRITKPLTGQIEESFQRRSAELPADTQRLLLVAAAEQQGDPDKVWRAAGMLGIGPEALGPAVDGGLLDMAGSVRFRHPLVRSAVYRSASLAERQAAHQALADTTDPEHDPDRRAWHRAAAAPAPDEDVAAELEHSAGRAQVRGGLTAAAAFFERAAELTPEPQHQAVRLLRAAGADLAAGANERARNLLQRSAPHLADPAARAQAMRMDGIIRFFDGHGGDTPGLLFEAAMAQRDLDAGLSRETLMETFEAAMWAGDLTSSTTMLDVATAARAIPAPEGDASTPSLMLTAYTERLTRGYAYAVPYWRRAADALPDQVANGNVQWHGMMWNATGELLDFDAHQAVGRERVRIAREQGALATLPVALSCLAWSERLAGRIDIAESLTAEARDIAAATGAPEMPGAHDILHMAMIAWRGREEETRAVVDAVTVESTARGQGLGVTLAQFCLVTLELALGHYDAARTAALRVLEVDPLYIGSIVLADVVEATARAGDLASAYAALARLTERAESSATPWGLGLLARARALVADDEDAEALYLRALDHLGRSGVATDLAQAQLLYGEWLRRQRRRRDAREQLRLAHEQFKATGGEAFAERAGAELRATGEHARARVAETRDELTPQERQIARLAASGESNAEIAAQLFISEHTVAYHLRKVYGKLAIGSRNQLPGALADRPEATALAGRR